MSVVIITGSSGLVGSESVDFFFKKIQRFDPTKPQPPVIKIFITSFNYLTNYSLTSY